jgi:hypothetical protein
VISSERLDRFRLQLIDILISRSSVGRPLPAPECRSLSASRVVSGTGDRWPGRQRSEMTALPTSFTSPANGASMVTSSALHQSFRGTSSIARATSAPLSWRFFRTNFSDAFEQTTGCFVRNAFNADSSDWVGHHLRNENEISTPTLSSSLSTIDTLNFMSRPYSGEGIELRGLGVRRVFLTQLFAV